MITRDLSPEERAKHGGAGPGDYEQKPELNNVWEMLEKKDEEIKEEKISERGVADGKKPELTIEDDLENAIRKPVDSNKYFCIDIETYADDMKDDFNEYQKTKKSKTLVQPKAIEKAIAEAESKFALSPITGQIILIGIMNNDGKIQQYGLDGATEKVTLEDGWRAINMLMDDGYRMISFNGKSFDIPYMFRRAIIKGIMLKPTIAVNELTHPYSNFYHYDVYNVLEWNKAGSLEVWNYLMGFGTTFESEGNAIAEWYEKKEYSTILSKNQADLRKTGRIYEILKRWVTK